MSQAKVDKYKEEKKNRKEIMAREKRKQKAGIAAAVLVGAAILGWAGVSAYQIYENSKPLETVYVDLTAIDDYMTSLETE